MSWLRRLFSTRATTSVKKAKASDLAVIVPGLPENEIENIMSDLTSMLGVSRAIAFNKANQLIFDYNRWSEEDGSPSAKKAIELVDYLTSFMSSVSDKPFENLIIRSKEVNILIQNAQQAVLCISTVETINLALISVRLRRAAIKLSKMLGGGDAI